MLNLNHCLKAITTVTDAYNINLFIVHEQMIIFESNNIISHQYFVLSKLIKLSVYPTQIKTEESKKEMEFSSKRCKF